MKSETKKDDEKNGYGWKIFYNVKRNLTGRLSTMKCRCSERTKQYKQNNKNKKKIRGLKKLMNQDMNITVQL